MEAKSPKDNEKMNHNNIEDPENASSQKRAEFKQIPSIKNLPPSPSNNSTVD